jgi:GLPGLI family protein
MALISLKYQSMKLFCILIFFLFRFLTFGQITEGKINYTIYQENLELEEEESAIVYPESLVEFHFSGEKTRNSVKTGSDMSVTTIIDNSAKKSMLIMTGMLGNLAITTSYEELVETIHSESDDIQYSQETKEIQGFLCKKAKIVTTTGSTITYWYTEDLQCNKAGVENMYNDIPGIPLEISIRGDGMLVRITATEIKTKIDEGASLFSTLAPAGFKVLTMAQFEAGEF